MEIVDEPDPDGPHRCVSVTAIAEGNGADNPKFFDDVFLADCALYDTCLRLRCDACGRVGEDWGARVCRSLMSVAVLYNVAAEAVRR